MLRRQSGGLSTTDARIRPAQVKGIVVTDYEFRSIWRISAPIDEVYDVVADVFSYPSWWSQVRAVVPVDERSARLVIRSVLPYALECEAESVVEDRAGGRLEVRLSGDVEGSARWRLRQEDGHTVLHYEQNVDAPNWPLRAARLIPWVPRANHAWMMRQGEKALQHRFAPKPRKVHRVWGHIRTKRSNGTSKASTSKSPPV